MNTRFAAWIAAVAVIIACAANPASAQLKAGAATSSITPPLGGDIVGGFLPIPAEQIHDELHARCLVLDDGNTKLAIVVLDLLAKFNGCH